MAGSISGSGPLSPGRSKSEPSTDIGPPVDSIEKHGYRATRKISYPYELHHGWPSSSGDIDEFEGGRYNYLHDPGLGTNPCRFSDSSYVYLGYAITDSNIYIDPALRNDEYNALGNIKPDAIGALLELTGSDPREDGNDIVDNDITVGDVSFLRYPSETPLSRGIVEVMGMA